MRENQKRVRKRLLIETRRDSRDVPFGRIRRGGDLPIRGGLLDADVRQSDLEPAKVELVYSASGRLV